MFRVDFPAPGSSKALSKQFNNLPNLRHFALPWWQWDSDCQR